MTTPDTDTIDPSSFPREIQQPEKFLVPFDPVALAAGQIGEDSFTFRGGEQVELSEMERALTQPLEPIETSDDDIKSQAHQFHDTILAYERRIKVLKEQAELDGYSLNFASEGAFFDFLQKNLIIRRGRLVLMENGNLRAIWKSERETHIGLQFLANQSIQYVIFTRRKPQLPVSRVSGRDTMDGIMKQIEAFDLGDVLYT